MEVYALVGPSGSGKSHRASLIAHQYGIDVIIDDGLLIKGSKILAGRSAKREHSRVAAIRRAMFFEPAQAGEVRRRLQELAPRRVLVLGTSRAMVHRILEAVDLPRPTRYISIQDVASPEEIRRALRIRREEGKHVIPAPTFEVKRTFSGYLVDPLRLRLFRRGRAPHAEMDVEKSVVRPTFSSLGRFYIADTVVSAIAGQACREVEGAAPLGRVAVQGSEEGVSLWVEVGLRYGPYLPGVMARVQRRVKEVVEHTTALNVLSVTVVARRVYI
ncbi:MAG: Asp23/Gls24 family envelope stress response protein [Acetobacteraceae bacterium]|nr:Asp23/Gls24 family envelope stress response protein [Acetobacteraceae bacterium]